MPEEVFWKKAVPLLLGSEKPTVQKVLAANPSPTSFVDQTLLHAIMIKITAVSKPEDKQFAAVGYWLAHNNM